MLGEDFKEPQPRWDGGWMAQRFPLSDRGSARISAALLPPRELGDVPRAIVPRATVPRAPPPWEQLGNICDYKVISTQHDATNTVRHQLKNYQTDSEAGVKGEIDPLNRPKPGQCGSVVDL